MTVTVTLIDADGARTPAPDPEQIALAVRALTIDNWFVILEQDDDTFVQVAVKADFYALERREGGDERHVGTEVSAIEDVVAAFQAYAVGDSSWIDRFSWHPVKL